MADAFNGSIDRPGSGVDLRRAQVGAVRSTPCPRLNCRLMGDLNVTFVSAVDNFVSTYEASNVRSAIRSVLLALICSVGPAYAWRFLWRRIGVLGRGRQGVDR